MEYKVTYRVSEIIELYGVDEIFIYDCIGREWIIPADSEKNYLDMEDITRMLLIRDLKECFGVNDEAIPIILHLIDQLHWSQAQARHYFENLER